MRVVSNARVPRRSAPDPLREPGTGVRKRCAGRTDPLIMDSNPDADPRPPLHSVYENDPDLRDLVLLFVDELDRRVDAIRQAYLAEDLATLQRISHQLKGAAGGYGFDPIGDSAARLEYELLHDEAELSALAERVEDLISCCRSAVPPRDA